MIDYDGYEEEVEIEKNRTVTSFFPKKHTTVKGIIYSYERWNANRGDDWANIVHMKEYIILYIMWKGYTEWEKIVDGDQNNSDYQLAYCIHNSTYPHELADVLFQFETKEKQRKVELRDRQKILKKHIKIKEKELKTIKKELLEMKKEN